MKQVLSVLVLVLMSAGARAQTCVLDAGSSHVAMTLKTNHDIVHGSFQVQFARIDLDRAGGKMAGRIEVGAGTGKTGNDTRDRKMTNEILHVPEYALITFEPRTYAGRLAAEGESRVQVTGVFTLLGTPHEVTVPMTVRLGSGACAAKGQMVIPYVAWGLKAPDFLFWKADHEVTVDLDLNGRMEHP